MAMRVALYVRVSTQRQAQAQTIEQQMERLTGYAREQGWDVPVGHVFRDEGYSGATLRRPGLDRLRDRAAARHLDLVLITAPDRLARNYVHQVLLLEELQGHGCEVRFLDRPMSQDPHDQLLLQIRGAVAEYERTLITERMRRGRQRKLEAGDVRLVGGGGAQLLFAGAAARAARDPHLDGAGALEPGQHSRPADEPGLCRMGLWQSMASPRHAGAALGHGTPQALGDEPGGCPA
jgi:DNA invertase Pin-like site-specific DNA recombinase